MFFIINFYMVAFFTFTDPHAPSWHEHSWQLP